MKQHRLRQATLIRLGLDDALYLLGVAHNAILPFCYLSCHGNRLQTANVDSLEELQFLQFGITAISTKSPA